MAVALLKMLSTRDLEPLSEILKGNSDPHRYLTDAARQVLAQIEHAIQHQQVHYVNYERPWEIYVLPTPHTPTAVLWQDGPLLWLHLPVFPAQVLNPYYEAVTCLVEKSQIESR